MTMREWWANVYEGGAHYENMGKDHERREDAAACDCEPKPYRPLYRIHVRLKPEGAPKRYASWIDRQAWERFPRLMQNGETDRAYGLCRGAYS